MRAIEAAAEAETDLQEVKMSKLNNVSVAIEFEYPFRAGQQNTKAIYNKNVEDLSKFLYIRQHSYSIRGFDTIDESTNKTINLWKNEKNRTEFQIPLENQSI